MTSGSSPTLLVNAGVRPGSDTTSHSIAAIDARAALLPCTVRLFVQKLGVFPERALGGDGAYVKPAFSQIVWQCLRDRGSNAWCRGRIRVGTGVDFNLDRRTNVAAATYACRVGKKVTIQISHMAEDREGDLEKRG